MIFDEIFADTLDWVGDSSLDVWTPAKITSHINDAYKHLLGELDRTKQAWMVEGPETIDVTEQASEFDFTPTIPMRKPIDALRLVEGMDPVPYDIVSFTQRLRPNARWLGRYAGLYDKSPRQVYVYRTPLAVWRVGFVIPPLEAFPLQIYYLPAFEPFKFVGITEGNAEPTLLPDDWHPLIAKRAAWNCKAIENRDSAEIQRLYLGDLAVAIANASSVVSQTKCRPI